MTGKGEETTTPYTYRLESSSWKGRGHGTAQIAFPKGNIVGVKGRPHIVSEIEADNGGSGSSITWSKH